MASILVSSIGEEMAIIKQEIIGGKTYAHFFPTESFLAEVRGKVNHYIKDMRYNLREGNTELADLVEEWQQDGKVKVSKGAA
jgi:hypothetical protein